MRRRPRSSPRPVPPLPDTTLFRSSGLGIRALADRVYCAKNREAALHAAYAGQPIKGEASCNTAGLDANEAFAQRNGLNGTPVIVRSDGAMIEGYRPRALLEDWLREARYRETLRCLSPCAAPAPRCSLLP